MIPLSDPEVPRSRRPYVTWAFIALNVLVFLYELTLGDIGQMAFFYRFGVVPIELTGGEDFTSLDVGDRVLEIATPIPLWGTLITSMFIHGGFAHILGNMVYLWVFGDNVEDRLGHLRYVLFYLACGLAAAGAHILFNQGSDVPTIGASGAIAGVLGAYLLLYPLSRVRTLVIFFFITVVRIPAVYLLGFWFLLQFFSSLGSLGVSAQSEGVAYWAHIGGFVVGAGSVALYRRLRGEPIWQPYKHYPWRWSRD